MKRRVALIQPYFGKLPNYFRLALNTYAHNAGYDWYIFTDDRTPYEFPPNVFVTYTTLEQIRRAFQQHFDFPIALDQPYKLCDYRPLYGQLFADRLSGYDYWGHFDPDIIFGDLDRFVQEAMSKSYDKLCSMGHFSLYRNIPAVNLLYQMRTPHCLFYRDVLASERNWGFDERDNGINAFFAAQNLKLYSAYPIADIYFRDYAMRLIGGEAGEKARSRNSCFAYEQGGVYRYFLHGTEIHREEFMYIHLMKRTMTVHCGNRSEYLIYGNAFRPRIPITANLLTTANRDKFFYHCFERLRYVVYARNLKPAIRLLFVERNIRKFFVRLLERMSFMQSRPRTVQISNRRKEPGDSSGQAEDD